MRTFRHRLVPALALLFAGTLAPLSAATLFFVGETLSVWTDSGGGSIWSTTGASADSTWSNGAANDATFSQASGKTLQVGGSIVAGTVTFGTTGYTLIPVDGSSSLQAATLRSNVASTTIGVPVILSGGGSTFDGSGNLTVSGVISGTANVTKSGTGSLFLTGNNTFNGQTSVVSGTLLFGNNGALGASTNTIRLGDTSGSADASLLISGGNYTVSQNLTVKAGNSGLITFGSSQTSGTATYSGNITLEKNTSVLQNAGGSLSLTGAISGSGATLAKWGGGTATLSGSSAVTVSAVNVVQGTLTFARSVSAGIGSVQVFSGATMRLEQATPFSGSSTNLTLDSGTVRLGAELNQVFGNLTNAGTSTLDFNSTTTSSLTFNGTVSIGGNLKVENYNYNTSNPAGSGPKLVIPGLSESTLANFTINGITGAAYFPSTNILVAVPEPSTYAACAGLFALGVAYYRRRRRLGSGSMVDR